MIHLLLAFLVFIWDEDVQIEYLERTLIPFQAFAVY